MNVILYLTYITFEISLKKSHGFMNLFHKRDELSRLNCCVNNRQFYIDQFLSNSPKFIILVDTKKRHRRLFTSTFLLILLTD